MIPPFALVVGEALVDVVRRPDGSVSEHAGGSPANVAVALRRLGRSVRLLTQYAGDRLGTVLDGHLRAEGVDVDRQRPRSGRTSSAEALIGPDGSASYAFDLEWSLEWRPERTLEGDLAGAAAGRPLVVHTGSLGAVLEPGAAAVLDLLDELRPHTTVSYDLNIRPGAMGPLAGVRARALAVVARADVVKASDEDLAHLFPDADPVAAARVLLEHGPAAVVLTRGGAGATAVTPALTVDVPAPPVAVADTIGAGDSFCAATLDGLGRLGALGGPERPALRQLDEPGWREVLAHAAAVAAITVARPGADPPTLAELRHLD